MAVPASVAPYLTASYTRGRYGAYAVTVYGPAAGAPPSPAALRLTARPEVPFGDVSAAFGGGLIAHSADYRFDDPDGLLDGYFGDDFDPADWHVRITGPNGFGVTWTVWTQPMRGELQGSASPLVTGDAPAALGTHDGLAALEDRDADHVSVLRVATVAQRAQYAMPGRPADAAADWWPVWTAWPITAPEAAAGHARDFRFAGEIAGEPDGGDFGTVYDQLRALCEGGTLSLFQPTDAPPDAPRWEAVPRSRVGTPTAYADPYVATGTTPDRARALPPHAADEAGTGAGRVRRVGTLRLTGAQQVAYATPMRTLFEGESLTVPLTYVSATPGLRFRIAVEIANPDADGTFRLELTADDGTTYYGPAWSTTSTEMAPGDVTTADAPASGSLAVVMVGANGLDGGGAEFRPGAVRFEDPDGAPVTDYAVRIGEPGGQAVEVALLPPLEVWDGAAWVDPSQYDGLVSGGSYGTLPSATAAERLAQQAVNLRQMTAEVTGIWGPEARFTVAGRSSGNARSPWDEDVVLVPTGGVPDLESGMTLLSLTATTETPAS
jgi:hypothetical protein